MTDCFIMIHVIIFFVGVTDTLSGNRCVWFGLSVLVSKEVQRGNLCSVGVCRVGLCFLNHCVQFPLVFFGVGCSYLYEARLNQTPLQNCHSSDPGCRHSLTPTAKTHPNWAIIHIQVPAICKYRAWGVHSTFLHWADLGFQLKQETQFSSFLKALFECYTY